MRPLIPNRTARKQILLKKRLKITTHRMARYFFQNHINLVGNFTPNYLSLYKKNFKIFSQKYNWWIFYEQKVDSYLNPPRKECINYIYVTVQIHQPSSLVSKDIKGNINKCYKIKQHIFSRTVTSTKYCSHSEISLSVSSNHGHVLT